MQENCQSRTLAPGTTLCNGKYVIEKILGAGGFGITYYARHTMLDHCYAIKEFFISGKCVRDTVHHTISLQDIDPEVYRKYQQRFVEEAKTLIELDHPGIVKVVDIFEENNTSYIVMNFVRGETIQTKVEKGGKLPYDLAVNYMAQLSDAVGYIHGKHILHRDIKPDNVIITPDSRAVLIDFGSAREFVNDEAQRHTTILTKGYAPPEQYTSTSKKGNYSDIYSLGAVFYYCLTGVKPIDAASRTIEELVNPISIVPEIPEEADRTIMKAMQLKPERRHQTAEEFMEDLLNTEKPEPEPVQEAAEEPEPAPQPEKGQEKEQEQEPIPEPTVAPAAEPEKESGKRPLWWIIPVVAILAGAILAIFLFSGKKSEEPAAGSLPSLTVNGVENLHTVLNSDKGTETFTIEKNFEERWTYSDVPEWASVSTDLNSITLNYTGNSSGKDRTATITFRKSGEDAILARLTVEQKVSARKSSARKSGQDTEPIAEKPQSGTASTIKEPTPVSTAPEGLEINGQNWYSKHDLDPKGGKYSATVSLKQGEMSALTVTASDDWFSATLGNDGYLNVTYSRNATFSQRYGTVKVQSGNETVTLSLSQESVPSSIDADLWTTRLAALLENPTYTYGSDLYKGQLSSNMVDREGAGLYRWSSGMMYIGSWKNNLKNGKGIYTNRKNYSFSKLPDARIIVSDFINDIPRGRMSCYDANGLLIYEGGVDNWVPASAYPASAPDKARRFEFITYSSSEYYLGETLNGTRHGYGLYVSADGCWIGSWSNNRKVEGTSF